MERLQARRCTDRLQVEYAVGPVSVPRYVGQRIADPWTEDRANWLGDAEGQERQLMWLPGIQ